MSKNKTKLYQVWISMRQRCYNPNDKRYANYGGRGIQVCDPWNKHYYEFETWAAESGYQEGLTLERIDNDGDYCPENCKWVTWEEQRLNKQNTIYTSSGVPALLECKKNNVPYRTFISRICNMGWDVDKACSEPVRLDRSFYSSADLVEYNGETKCLKDWCAELGLNYTTVWKRIKKGWDVEKAFFSQSRKKIVEYKGETRELSYFQRMSGLAPASFYERLRNGWTLEEAIETPKGQKRKVVKKNDEPDE